MAGFRSLLQIQRQVGSSFSGLPMFSAQSPSAIAVGTAYSYTFAASSSPTFSVASGSLPPGLALNAATGVLSGTPTTAGIYQFVIRATNSYGSTDTPTIIFNTTVSAKIRQQPVVGQPLYVDVDGTIATIQYYMNDGSGAGPVAVDGATAYPYTPVAADNDKWPSVRGTLVGGIPFASMEFTGPTHAQLSKGDVGTPVPTDLRQPIGSGQLAFKYRCVNRIRSIIGTHYVDCILAPGQYTTYDPLYNFNDLTTWGASSSLGVGLLEASCPPVVTPLAARPATAVRGSGDTGTGFFVKNGELYDANGNAFRPRGVNVGAYDSLPPSRFTSKSSSVRVGYPPNGDFTTVLKPLFDGYIANKIVPMACSFFMAVVFSGTIVGNTLTVDSNYSSAYGYLYVGAVIQAGNGVAACTVTQVGDGSTTFAKSGTFTVSGAAQNVTTSVAMKSPAISITNNQNAACALAMVATILDYRSDFAQYDQYMLWNFLNEWGPVYSSTNTVWRDTWVQIVAMARAKGVKTTIVIDCPGSGQDKKSLIQVNSNGKTYAQEIWESDTAGGTRPANIMFSYHVYGQTLPGDLYPFFAQLRALSDSVGMAFVIGEYGPARMTSGQGEMTMIEALEVITAAEAAGIGHFAWAVDNPADSIVDTGYALVYKAGSWTPGGGGYQANVTGSIATFTNLVGGTGYNDGVYKPCQMTGGAGSGAYLEITVVGGTVTKVSLVTSKSSPFLTGGHGYAVGDTISYASSTLGSAGSGFSVKVGSVQNFPDGNPAELTTFGKQVFPKLAALAVKASIFA